MHRYQGNHFMHNENIKIIAIEPLIKTSPYCSPKNTLLDKLTGHYEIMYQSTPAVNIPRRPPGIRTSFLPSPPGFYLQICARGPRFRRGQIFPEMSENLLNIFIFRGCFQEAIQNGRKNSRFCLRKLHLSPRISLLNQLKE